MTSRLPTLPFAAALTAALLLVGTAPASPQRAPVETEPARAAADSGRFDLVVIGNGPGFREAGVELRENPSAGGAWRAVRTGPVSLEGQPPGAALVVARLRTSRYLGQDIRQNHLMLRLSVPDGAGAQVRAVYAVPHTGTAADTLARRLVAAAERRPVQVRRRSLASLVRPRPARLAPGDTLTTPVEAPVRHRRPGVLEVRWLEILYRNQ
jgi:hypothetical protein